MRFSLIIVALLTAFLAPNFFRGNWDSAQAEAVEERPRLVAALFRSSWCGACRIIEPRIEDVREDYEDAAMEFVRFDFTLGRRDSLRETALEAGIAELYDQLEGRTGFLVLMDRETGQVFEIITTNYNRENIAAAFDRWLAVTTFEEA
ncbi:MAG: hypothetical protein GYB36_08175 [Alphaproteobacteria bacterium]|nr:hypothetical protein [Alphaproteobacteria bacterium]